MKDIKYYCTPETVGELCGMFLVVVSMGRVSCVNFLKSLPEHQLNPSGRWLIFWSI